ncbi:hypothetical protein [uncultured Shimia sp.]|uniref:hypothetical protein n=1 Tax=uncultured Shimia sp. TaxID=573152 RepID=UPI002636BBBD|nr:hypothetical protein [uncultured Shimia sp.]
MRLGLVLALMATPALAEDWKMRGGDNLFDEAGLQAALTGQTLVFYDDGQSVYGDDGSYSYTYGGGGTWEGQWRVAADSVVCVTYVTEVTRCDRIVENAGRLVVLTEDGQRFPVKP